MNLSILDDFKEVVYSSAREEIRDLVEYNPGPMPEDVVRVSANENNLGVSPLALAFMTKALAQGNRYPDSTCTTLRCKLAELSGVLPDEVIVSNGLDGLFTMLGRAFLRKGDEVVTGELTFSVYADTASIMGAKNVLVPMRDDLSLDVEGFISAINDKTKLVFFCNPNNPSGSFASIEDVVRIVEATPKSTIFVLDEAYIDFADECVESGISLVKRFPNLLVCRTFSKLYGLAGLRVGWAVGNRELLRFLYKVREPYCVSYVATEGALGALSDVSYAKKTYDTNKEERVKLISALEGLQLEVFPSQTNFIFVFSDKAQKIRSALFEKGIVIRALSFRKKQALRISVGLPCENELLIKELRNIL
ncbi:MAG: histidinol-phosphate transaminase [Synergistaceae bacterium]